MPDDAYTAWKKSTRESLLMSANQFIDGNDRSGLVGLASLGLSSRINSNTQVAINTLFNEVINSRREAKGLKERLRKEEVKLRQLGLFDTMERRSVLLEQGWVPLSRLLPQVTGFRKEAREIYWDMKIQGVLLVEDFTLRDEGTSEQWVRFPPNWDVFFEEIESRGEADVMYTFLFSTVLDIGLTGRGLSTLDSLMAIVSNASRNSGEVSIDDIMADLGNIKTANIMLQKVMELSEPLRIFESRDGNVIRINANAIHAVAIILENRREIGRRRGLDL